ncbi:MAG: hypothetical protein K2Q22_10110, partial [Cytophagales bacterium]|nr:hypothetical protein [Cytophagales bacterium]
SFITGTDSVIFQYSQADLYTIGLDPCSPKLKELGVKYVAFGYQPQAAETRCLTLVSSNGLLIFKRND